MSLVPFEKPRPEDRLPDPFDGAENTSPERIEPVATGTASARPWVVPRSPEGPTDDRGRRLPPPIERDRVVPFRRREQRVPIRRRTPWRRWIRPLAGALAIVGTPVALVFWFLTSARFALTEWHIHTSERVEASWIASRLAAFEGRNLFQLDLRQVEERLQHPWLAGVDLRKEFPSRLVVRVIERRAVALWRGAEGLSYVDGDGRLIAPLSLADAPAEGVSFVLLSRRQTPGRATADTAEDTAARESRDIAARRSAVALLREIEELESPLLKGLAEIQALGGEDFEIFTSELPFPLLVRAGTLEAKTRRLEEILPGLMERHGVPSAVDLRFRRRIIVEPSTPTGTGPVEVERNR